MHAYLEYLIVYGGILTAAAAGLSIQLRLVRFFDLSWALWVVASSFVSVYVARSFGQLVGILSGTLLAALIAMLENGVLLHRLLVTHVRREAIERITFVAAAGVYLALLSTLDLFGFRGQEMVPASASSVLGLSLTEFWAAIFCWLSLLVWACVRLTSLGLRLRALLDNSVTVSIFGLPVRRYSIILSLAAGSITGVAASSFGILYRAHSSAGLTLMLLAVVPCLVVGVRSSLRVVAAALVTTAFVGVIRIRFGYSVAEIIMQLAVVAVLFFFPRGISGREPRAV